MTKGWLDVLVRACLCAGSSVGSPLHPARIVLLSDGLFTGKREVFLDYCQEASNVLQALFIVLHPAGVISWGLVRICLTGVPIHQMYMAMLRFRVKICLPGL